MSLPQKRSISPEEVRELIDDIVERNEFEAGPSMFERYLEWIFDTLGVGDAVAVAFKPVLWIVFGLLVVLAIWFSVQVVRANQRAKALREGGHDGDGPSPRARAARLRSEAQTARQAGDLRLALRLNLFALVVGLGARGNLRYRDAWTNRELLDRGRPAEETYALLAPLVREFEAMDFGRAPVQAADLDRLEETCTEHLGPLEGGHG